MARVPLEPDRGRFSGLSRSRGVDGREVSPLRSARAHAVRLETAATGRRWLSAAGNGRFDEPIPLLRGRQLVTLGDAGNYITKLPRAEHEAAEWQSAMEALILVATLGGPTMFARIGVMRALNRNVELTLNLSRKERHWGRRKLARDR